VALEDQEAPVDQAVLEEVPEDLANNQLANRM